MSLSKNITRRDFIKTTAAASLAAAIPGNLGLFAAGSDALRIGVIGCGGRGTGAAINCLEAAEGIEIVALGDLVPDRIESSYRKLMEKFPDRVRVPAGNRFTGFDNHLKVCALPEVNLIVTAAPPGFRPIHLKAAVEAGKHVFMEKPVAVDPAGVRAVIASSEAAAAKGLAVVAGTQRRHQKSYLELMRRIRDGQIGEIVGDQCYWNQGDLWVKLPDPGMSEMEWQCRTGSTSPGRPATISSSSTSTTSTWSIGDRRPPEEHRRDGRPRGPKAPEYGNIYDHFAVEFEYPNGVRAASYCRQTEGCADRVEERIIGTKGTAFGYGEIKGEKPWTFEGPEPDPYVPGTRRLGRLDPGGNAAE